MSTLKQLVDETTNIKNELKTCHANLKANLIDKGVEVLKADKIANLVNKVGNIELGKKWASGTALTPGRQQRFTSQNGNTRSLNVLDIPMPNFKPTTVFYIGKDSQSFGIISDINGERLRSKPYLLYIDSFDIDTNTTGTYCYSLKADSLVFNGNVISVPVFLANAGVQFTWIAFE